MKKIRLLQLLVYITFGLMIVHDVLPDVTRGFKDGWKDGEAEAHGQASSRYSVPAVLYGNVLTHNESGLKINESYALRNIYIDADVVINTQTPADKILVVVNIALVFGISALLILIAININQIVIYIANGDVFDNRCVRYLQRVGIFLLAYATVDASYQRLKIAMLRSVIHEPLQVYNTTSFNFQVLICAILVFIAAEAFKYGARLKTEQELTI